jgi:MFS family permease
MSIISKSPGNRLRGAKPPLPPPQEDPLVRRGSMFAVVAESKPFRRLILASVMLALGQWMQGTALGWLALELTDSESFVGLVAFCGGLPFLLVSIPGGLIIDRFDRRNVIIACQILVAILSAIVAIDVLTGTVRPWHLPIAVFINGSLQAVLGPAQQSILPNLVPAHRLTNAIGLMSAGQNMTRIVGPTIAGAVIGFAGTGQAISLQVVTVSIALVLIVITEFPARLAARTTASLSSLLEGARVVADRPDLRVLFLLVSIPTLLVFPYLSFMSIFARDVLKIGPQGLGVLMAASGIGAVFGSLFVASRATMPSGRNQAIQSILYGLSVVGFAFTTFLPVTLLFLAAAGFLASSFMSANNAILQHRVDDSIRGRIFGIYMLTFGLMPIGTLPIGWVSSAISAPVAVGGAALISAALTTVLFLTSKSLRDL